MVELDVSTNSDQLYGTQVELWAQILMIILNWAIPVCGFLGFTISAIVFDQMDLDITENENWVESMFSGILDPFPDYWSFISWIFIYLV